MQNPYPNSQNLNRVMNPPQDTFGKPAFEQNDGSSVTLQPEFSPEYKGKERLTINPEYLNAGGPKSRISYVVDDFDNYQAAYAGQQLNGRAPQPFMPNSPRDSMQHQPRYSEGERLPPVQMEKQQSLPLQPFSDDHYPKGYTPGFVLPPQPRPPSAYNQPRYSQAPFQMQVPPQIQQRRSFDQPLVQKPSYMPVDNRYTPPPPPVPRQGNMPNGYPAPPPPQNAPLVQAPSYMPPDIQHKLNQSYSQPGFGKQNVEAYLQGLSLNDKNSGNESDYHSGSDVESTNSYLAPPPEERPTFTTMIRKHTILREKQKEPLSVTENIEMQRKKLVKGDNKQHLEFAELLLGSEGKYADEGFALLRKLANSGYPEAIYVLGDAYADDGKLSLAYTQYYSAAKRSYAPACFKVADCAEYGKGCKKSQRLAMEMYTKAATAGNLDAMYRLGKAELNGSLGLHPDIHKAIKWFKRACAVPSPEHPEPLFELFKIYERGIQPYVVADLEYARGCLTEASDFGYAPANYRLGYCYEHGLLGFEINPPESIRLYKKACETNHADAQLALAGWYMTGADGFLKQDTKLAFELVQKSASQELPRAQYTLGYFYDKGVGVPPNDELAQKYYKIAADKGEERAIKKVLERNPKASIKNYNDKKKKGGFFSFFKKK
ncbi:hypothetical protein HDV06_005132 [Boothiomyces sp. JEL0866]|nr:hypothetical protein HDV06_005132 [Boothiomyces sp. JEL0866]